MGLAPREQFGTPQQIEVLLDMESAVQHEIEQHKARRNLWFPNDHLSADADQAGEWEEEVRIMRERARSIPDAVRVALALSLLTEEGLPHFHRLIAIHFGGESSWTAWNNLWTAEEDRHGCAIRDYVRDARVYNMGALERFQYLYIEAGFDPDWERDPYRLIAYTSLQEKATQISHAGISRLASSHEPMLQRVLAHVASDEARHHMFYRAVFGEMLARDPNGALVSLQKVLSSFSMPGHSVACFDDMSEVIRRSGIFGPRQFQKVVEDLLEFWKIGAMVGLSAEGAKAQEKMMKVPVRMQRMADYIEQKTTPRTFRFDFIYNRDICL